MKGAIKSKFHLFTKLMYHYNTNNLIGKSNDSLKEQRVSLMKIKNMAFNSVAGYHIIKEMNIPEVYPTRKVLESFITRQFSKNGLYIGTFFEEEKRIIIDELIHLIEEKKSILEFRNGRKIFNTMVNNDEEYIAINNLDDSSSFDRGRNQLKVDECMVKKLQAKAIQVGQMLLDQVCTDLNIPEYKRGKIYLSILETEASKGRLFY